MNRVFGSPLYWEQWCAQNRLKLPPFPGAKPSIHIFVNVRLRVDVICHAHTFVWKLLQLVVGSSTSERGFKADLTSCIFLSQIAKQDSDSWGVFLVPKCVDGPIASSSLAWALARYTFAIAVVSRSATQPTGSPLVVELRECLSQCSSPYIL